MRTSGRLPLRGQWINTDLVVSGGETVILTLRDSSGERLEVAQYGALSLHIGDDVLTSEGDRQDIEERYGYSAAREMREQPGGQDSGVWVWAIPSGARGSISIEADWLRDVAPGTAEIMLSDHT